MPLLVIMKMTLMILIPEELQQLVYLSGYNSNMKIAMLCVCCFFLSVSTHSAQSSAAHFLNLWNVVTNETFLVVNC